MKTITTVSCLVSLVSVVIGPVSSAILYAETAPMPFEVWAADLKPGFVLDQKVIGTRTCYCKNPGPFASYSSTSSFAFNTPATLTSSGLPGSSFDYIFLTPGGGGTGAGGGNTNVATKNTTTTPSVRTTGACGQCNMEITIDNSYNGQTYHWSSPGWSNGQSYPDGCTCVLKVHYRSTNYASILWTFDSTSVIKSVNNCAYDRMLVNLNGATTTWCDTTLPSKSGTEPIMAVDADYTFTFISDPGDGNQVAKGFDLAIQVIFYGR